MAEISLQCGCEPNASKNSQGDFLCPYSPNHLGVGPRNPLSPFLFSLLPIIPSCSMGELGGGWEYRFQQGVGAGLTEPRAHLH